MTHIEREARKVVTAAQKLKGPLTVRYMVAQTNAAPSRELTDEIRRVLAVKRGWFVSDFKRNGRQMWVYRKPEEGEAWGSGAEAVEHAKSGRAERPDDGLRALPPEDGVNLTDHLNGNAAGDTTLRDILDEAEANTRNLTLEVKMDPHLRKALDNFKRASEKSDRKRGDTLGMYRNGRSDGIYIGWGFGLPAGVALTLLAMLAVMWWVS